VTGPCYGAAALAVCRAPGPRVSRLPRIVPEPPPPDRRVWRVWLGPGEQSHPMTWAEVLRCS